MYVEGILIENRYEIKEYNLNLFIRFCIAKYIKIIHYKETMGNVGELDVRKQDRRAVIDIQLNH